MYAPAVAFRALLSLLPIAAPATIAPATIAPATTARAQDPVEEPPPPPFRLAAVDLELELDFDRPWLDGRATLVVENWSDAPASELPLLVGRLMEVGSVTGPDGRPLPFEQDVVAFEDWTLRQVNAVRVRLPEPVAPGDSTRVIVRYAGHLVPATETGMRYVRDHLDPAFTALRAEAFAFPQVGGTSFSAIRAVPRRPFRYTARVTVPDTLVVGTGGEVVERRVADGRATYHIRGPRPVPFLNLTVAPYEVQEDGGVRVYLLPDDAAYGAELLETVARALAWYGERYGPLPREPAFAIMEIPDGWGSQAHLDAGIMLEASSLTAREDRAHLYHEISHLWNAPDAEAPSPRWNEGLATYLQERVAAELDGADLADARAALARSVCRQVAGREAVRRTPLVDYGREGLTGWSYPVGALLFHVLDEVMGPEPFDQAYRGLYQSTRGTTVTVADLEGAFTRTDDRAAPVFRDWLHSTRWHGLLCEAHDGDLAAAIADYR